MKASHSFNKNIFKIRQRMYGWRINKLFKFKEKKSDSQTLIKNNIRNIVVLKYTLRQFIL